MPTPLSVERISDTEHQRVTIHGSLDFYAIDTLEAHVRDAFRDRRALELDLSDVGFLDSAGLGAIVSIVHRAQAAGIPVWLAETMSPQVSRLLRLTGMAARLPIGEPPPAIAG